MPTIRIPFNCERCGRHLGDYYGERFYMYLDLPGRRKVKVIVLCEDCRERWPL